SEIIGVHASFTPYPPDGSEPKPGHNLAFHMAPRQDDINSLSYVWMIHFNRPPRGCYQLTVTGLTAKGHHCTHAKIFHVEAPKGEPTDKSPDTTITSPDRTIVILSHTDCEDITEERNEFSPYGTLDEYDVDTVTMQRTDTSPAPAPIQGFAQGLA